MQEYYKFINEPLPYSYKAMEPFIDIQTMYLHHDKHLQTYVDNLNRALRDYPFLQTFTLEQLLCNLESCLLYTSPSPRDGLLSRMPSSA